jgi:hypothetical protein
MNKYTGVLFFLLIFNSAFSQVEKDNFKLASTKFVAFFNNNKYDSIVAMFSPEMKTALPIEKFTQFSTGLKNQLGLIRKTRFVRLQQTTALYETFFDNSVLGMNIVLNNRNEISGLLFKPYAEAKTIETNSTAMFLPFKGVLTVFWGGDIILCIRIGKFQCWIFQAKSIDQNNIGFFNHGCSTRWWLESMRVCPFGDNACHFHCCASCHQPNDVRDGRNGGHDAWRTTLYFFDFLTTSGSCILTRICF